MGEHYGILGKHPHKRSSNSRGPRGNTRLLGSSPGPTGHKDLAAAQALAGKDLVIHVPAGLGRGPRDINSPLLVPPKDVGDFLTVKATKMPIGGIWGDVTAGSNWRVADGSRFVVLPTYSNVLYYQNGNFFIQSGAGFVGEVTSFVFIDAARHCVLVQRVFETELKLLLGIIAGISGVGFIAVIGSEAFAFVVEHRDDFAVWQKAWTTFLEVRETLKKCSPALYDNLVNEVLRKFGKSWYGELEKAAEKPETIAFFIGVVIGHIAKRVTARGPLTPLFLISTLLTAVIARFVMDVGPDAVIFAAEKVDMAATEMMERARKDGVTLTRENAEQIYREINQNRACVTSALKKLSAAMDATLLTFSKEPG